MQKIWVVDAFTGRAFAGNPAGVCISETALDESWMRRLASEMKHAETAFAFPHEGGYALRWFTPSAEVPLCGHATLATAHTIWQAGFRPKSERLRFQTKSGDLFATYLDDGWIELDFPRLDIAPLGETGDVKAALGASIIELRRYSIKLLAELESEKVLRRLKPDLSAIASLNAKGVIVTARAATKPYDFVSRYFAPALGVDEDPVTGSAHCALAPYWSEKLKKDSMLAYQASPRSGEMRVRLAGDRVCLAGQAVTVLEGELHV